MVPFSFLNGCVFVSMLMVCVNGVCARIFVSFSCCRSANLFHFSLSNSWHVWHLQERCTRRPALKARWRQWCHRAHTRRRFSFARGQMRILMWTSLMKVQHAHMRTQRRTHRRTHTNAHTKTTNSMRTTLSFSCLFANYMRWAQSSCHIY